MLNFPFSPLAGEMPKACPGLDPGAEGVPCLADRLGRHLPTTLSGTL